LIFIHAVEVAFEGVYKRGPEPVELIKPGIPIPNWVTVLLATVHLLLLAVNNVPVA
jgi:hypothetical protein